MIFNKFVGLVAAFAAIAAAAAVCMIALAFAIYAGLRDIIGPAWAAAAVAGIVAFIALVIAFVITRKARPKPVKGDSQNLTAKLIELARERPLVAIGAVAAAATVMLKNPRILTAIVAAAFAPRPPASEALNRPRRGGRTFRNAVRTRALGVRWRHRGANGENLMLGWALTFLVVALIAGVLGFTTIAGAAVGIAKIAFYVFIVLFVVSLIMNFVRGRGTML